MIAHTVAPHPKWQARAAAVCTHTHDGIHIIVGSISTSKSESSVIDETLLYSPIFFRGKCSQGSKVQNSMLPCLRVLETPSPLQLSHVCVHQGHRRGVIPLMKPFPYHNTRPPVTPLGRPGQVTARRQARTPYHCCHRRCPWRPVQWCFPSQNPI